MGDTTHDEPDSRPPEQVGLLMYTEAHEDWLRNLRWFGLDKARSGQGFDMAASSQTSAPRRLTPSPLPSNSLTFYFILEYS